MKVRVKKLQEKERMRTLDVLYTAAGAIRGRAAMKLFLRDLLTESERIMLGRRIMVARKLMRGDSYSKITKSLGVGPDTIYRVHQWLSDQMPGYERAIMGMDKEFEKRKDRKLYATSGLYRLKRKYPLHFLLFPTPKLKEKDWDF